MVQACFRRRRTQNFLRRPTMMADVFYATPSQKPRSAPVPHILLRLFLGTLSNLLLVIKFQIKYYDEFPIFFSFPAAAVAVRLLQESSSRHNLYSKVLRTKNKNTISLLYGGISLEMSIRSLALQLINFDALIYILHIRLLFVD